MFNLLEKSDASKKLYYCDYLIVNNVQKSFKKKITDIIKD